LVIVPSNEPNDAFITAKLKKMKLRGMVSTNDEFWFSLTGGWACLVAGSGKHRQMEDHTN